MRPGVQSSIQDLGRPGYGRFGIPPAGAMDPWSLQVTNALLGNPAGAAAVEMTLAGVKARCLAPSVVALGGGEGEYFLNGQRVAPWQSLALSPGDMLDVGGISRGCRVYLGVHGGIEVPVVLGSRSTYLPASLGGKEGRALRRGDILRGHPCEEKHISRRLLPSLRPVLADKAELRVLRGLHAAFFPAEEWERFLASDYTVTPRSNRMGCRLAGEAVKARSAGNLISDALVTGAIQVPPDGEPIILGVDRQTTGGYPVIAALVTADLAKVGQLPPGQIVRFRAISLAEAQELKEKQAKFLRSLSLWGKETFICGR
nr:biotin-dependent carboxyltransferase family protein [Acididesulfobacillus acetoxydans]